MAYLLTVQDDIVNNNKLPPDPPKPIKRRSLLGAPPLPRISLLGPPPTLRRTPGLPSPLSVFFCNLHGRPRKFERKSSYKEKFHRTQVFTNTTNKFSRCTPDELRKFSTSSARNMISAIISDIIDTIDVTNSEETANVSNSTDNTININEEVYDDEKLLNESVNTLDDSSITDSFGEPIPSSSSSSSSSSFTHSLN